MFFVITFNNYMFRSKNNCGCFNQLLDSNSNITTRSNSGRRTKSNVLCDYIHQLYVLIKERLRMFYSKCKLYLQLNLFVFTLRLNALKKFEMYIWHGLITKHNKTIRFATTLLYFGIYYNKYCFGVQSHIHLDIFYFK